VPAGESGGVGDAGEDLLGLRVVVVVRQRVVAVDQLRQHPRQVRGRVEGTGAEEALRDFRNGVGRERLANLARFALGPVFGSDGVVVLHEEIAGGERPAQQALDLEGGGRGIEVEMAVDAPEASLRVQLRRMDE